MFWPNDETRWTLTLLTSYYIPSCKVKKKNWFRLCFTWTAKFRTPCTQLHPDHVWFQMSPFFYLTNEPPCSRQSTRDKSSGMECPFSVVVFLFLYLVLPSTWGARTSCVHQILKTNNFYSCFKMKVHQRSMWKNYEVKKCHHNWRMLWKKTFWISIFVVKYEKDYCCVSLTVWTGKCRGKRRSIGVVNLCLPALNWEFREQLEFST